MNALQSKINEVITSNDNFKSIRFNTKTNKIEMNGMKICTFDYTDIYEVCVEQYPEYKITKSLVKDCVTKYAREHQFNPNEKKNNGEKSDWYSKIILDKNDVPVKSLENVVSYFNFYPKYLGKFAYNEFTQYESFDGDIIRDFHISDFRLDCEKSLGFDSKDKVETAVQILTHKNSFNPFKKALEAIRWDGLERAESLFIDALAVEDTQLNRSLTKKWLYAMIKRLYEPGCHFDNVVIIYDQTQGTGKSKLMERLVKCLGINYGYDTTVTCDSTNKDNIDKLNKAWVVGFDEMAAFTKKENEQVKQFVSQSEETARLSYAKRSENYKRHCVFYGNTNENYFLKDYTSSFERRYWIMEAHGEKHSAEWWQTNFPDEYLRQVLAEMKYFYDTNPNFDYTSITIDEQKELESIQFKHKTLQNDDILIGKILDMLNKDFYKTTFNSYDDFLKNVRSEITITRPETNEFFGLKSSEKEDLNTKIEYIPVKWLKQYVIEELKRPITTQYLTTIISKEWDYKVVKYNKVATNCYRRI